MVSEYREYPGYHFGRVYEVKPRFSRGSDGGSFEWCPVVCVCEFERIEAFRIGGFLKCFGVDWVPMDNEDACVSYIGRKYRERRAVAS